MKDQQTTSAERHLIETFVRATGLRRYELATLRVGDILDGGAGVWVVQVTDKTHHPVRTTTIERAYEDEILAFLQDRPAHEKVFAHLPRLHPLRVEYARTLFERWSDHGSSNTVMDEAFATQLVADALGEDRLDVVRRYYLGRRRKEQTPPQAPNTSSPPIIS